MKPFPRLAVPTVLALSLLALPACSGDEDQPEAGAASTAPVLQPGRPGEPNATVTGTPDIAENEPNQADVDFMQHMIVHHAQAVEMVDIVEDELTDTQVLAIAQRIRDSQKPEILGMVQWLERNEEDVPPEAAVATADGHDEGPDTDHGDHDQHGDHGDHGGSDAHNDEHHMDMPGMATPEQLQSLGQARGAEADVMFLELMIAHHEGALDMVIDQGTEGQDVLAGEMADDIYAVQMSEIGDMEEMLARLEN